MIRENRGGEKKKLTEKYGVLQVVWRKITEDSKMINYA